MFGKYLLIYRLPKKILFILLFLLFELFTITECKKKLKEQDIIQRVLKDYDWRVCFIPLIL